MVIEQALVSGVVCGIFTSGETGLPPEDPFWDEDGEALVLSVLGNSPLTDDLRQKSEAVLLSTTDGLA
jgi:hypothetical protein